MVYVQNKIKKTFCTGKDNTKQAISMQRFLKRNNNLKINYPFIPNSDHSWVKVKLKKGVQEEKLKIKLNI